MAETKGGRQQRKFRLNLVGYEKGDERPAISVLAVDRAGKVLVAAPVGADGSFDLPADVAKKAHRIILSPRSESPDDVDKDVQVAYRTEQFFDLIGNAGVLNVAEGIWKKWFFFTKCVTGSVKRCYRPWIIRHFAKQAGALTNPLLEARAVTMKSRAALDVSERLVPPDLVVAVHCDVICSGVVEVYRRTCCCEPWVIGDIRLPELVRDLEDLIGPIVEAPDLPFPPRPEPDPPPFDVPFLRSGALDMRVLNARRDLHAIKSLPEKQLVAYINARPYLLCRNECSAPKKVAEGFINPDGRFQICWSEWPYLVMAHCKQEYAYKVRQLINGVWTTIYDGVAANIWFDYDEDASLVSYDVRARACRHNDFPGEGPFALLQDIGDTNSWRLATPNASGWDQVGPAAYNSGLIDPVANPASALGVLKNRNLGGTLKLLYHFSEPMRDIGAVYYRISVRPTDATGQPTGAAEYLSDGLSWKYFSGGGDVLPESLGPVTVGTESNLYKIPYDFDRDWQGNQYHGYLNTKEARFNTPGRYLLTLEVFNAAGRRLRPTGTADPGDGVPGSTAAFTFRRWYQEFGPTAVVPYAALTHMLWWDNRVAEAVIVDLRVGGSPNTSECQFLEGPGSQTFSVGYRAYHPQEMFLLYHSLWWRRGLGGPSDHMVSASPYNAGYPPAGPLAVSPSHTFSHMLSHPPVPPDGLTRCTFSLHLRTWVKTTDGEGSLDYGDYDYGSFALAITP